MHAHTAPHPHPYTNVWPEGCVVVLYVKQNMLFCCVHWSIISYSHTKFHVSQLAPLASYVHKFAPIIMYGLGLFIVVLTRTTMFTKFAI